MLSPVDGNDYSRVIGQRSRHASSTSLLIILMDQPLEILHKKAHRTGGQPDKRLGAKAYEIGKMITCGSLATEEDSDADLNGHLW
jgi:hypothetical protein